MHHTLNRCAKPVAAALAVLLSLATVAPPALAAESAPPQAGPASLRVRAAAHVAALDAAALAAAQDTAAPAAEESQSFFKSRKGVIGIVLFAAGVTITFVSKSRDRVKSQIRN